MATKDSNEENKASKGSSGEEDFGLPDINFDELEELGDDIDLDGGDDIQEAVEAAKEFVEDNVTEPVAEAVPDVVPDVPKEEPTGLFSDSKPGEAISEGMDEDTMSELEEAGQLLFEATLLEEDIYKADSEGDSSLADFEKKEDTPSPIEQTQEESVKLTSKEEKPIVEDTTIVAEGAAAVEDASSTNAGLFSVDESLKTEEEVNFEEPEQPAVTASINEGYNQYADTGNVKSGLMKFIAIGVGALLLLGGTIWFMTSGDDKKTKKVAKTEKKVKPAAKKTTSKVKKTASENVKSQTTSKTSKTSVKPISDKSNEQLKKELNKKLGGKKTSTVKSSKPTKPKKAVAQPKKTVTSSNSSSSYSNATSSGVATTISERTGRSYIVVGSFTDEAIAQGYADKLASSGGTVSVLMPMDTGVPNVRVAIADFSSVREALNNIDAYKPDYGDDIWILKH